MQRKRYSKELKEQLVKEAIETGNASLVGRKHGVDKSVICKWVRDEKTSAKQAFQSATIKKYPDLEDEPYDFENAVNQNEKLKRLLGERELEIAILRDLLKKTNSPLPKRLQ